MMVIFSIFVIAATLVAMFAAIGLTLADYGSQIGRAWRMEPLPPRGDNFRARKIRQPVVSPSGRIAPDRCAVRRVAA